MSFNDSYHAVRRLSISFFCTSFCRDPSPIGLSATSRIVRFNFCRSSFDNIRSGRTTELCSEGELSLPTLSNLSAGLLRLYLFRLIFRECLPPLNSTSGIERGGSVTDSGLNDLAGSTVVDPALDPQSSPSSTSSTDTLRFPVTVVGLTVRGRIFLGRNFSSGVPSRPRLVDRDNERGRRNCRRVASYVAH